MSELGPFRDAAVAHLEVEIEACAPVPDLLAIAERARELEPQRITEDFVAAVGQLAPVFPLSAAREGGGLQPFTDAARELLQERVAEPAPAPAGRRVRPVWFVAGLAAAAVAILGIAWGTSSSVVPDERRAPVQAVRALDVVPDSVDSAHQAIFRHPEAPSSPRSRDVVPDEPAPPLPTEPVDHGKPRPSLSELDAQAQRAWAAGRVDEAERLFRTIVRRGGHSRYVELAFGDLFAIARQHRDARERKRLWKAYLKRFPRGRFAQDARAELCRRDKKDAAKCWADYLRKHPNGSHAAEARAATE